MSCEVKVGITPNTFEVDLSPEVTEVTVTPGLSDVLLSPSPVAVDLKPSDQVVVKLYPEFAGGGGGGYQEVFVQEFQPIEGDTPWYWIQVDSNGDPTGHEWAYLP